MIGENYLVMCQYDGESKTHNECIKKSSAIVTAPDQKQAVRIFIEEGHGGKPSKMEGARFLVNEWEPRHYAHYYP